MIRSLLGAALLLALATPAIAADEADRYVLFPQQTNRSALRQMVEFEIVLAHCPDVKRGPNAWKPWRYLRDTYRHIPMDVERVKDFVRYEIVRTAAGNLDGIKPITGWCDGARKYYGVGGPKFNGAIANRDGSEARPKCYKDGTCLSANSIDIYFD